MSQPPTRDAEISTLKCSVIIPTRLRSGILRETLDSLAKQTEKSFEVIVVCDGEDSQTRELADGYRAPFSLRWIFLPEQGGRSAARNAGAKAAASGLFLFLDDDMTQTPELIALHWSRHEAHQGQRGVAVIGRIVHVYSHPPRSRMDRLFRESLEYGRGSSENAYARMGPDFARFVYFVPNCSISRSLFVATGEFDPALGRGGREEFDYGTRLYNAGVHFEVEPRAVVYHRGWDLERHPCFWLERRGFSDLYRARRKRQLNPQTRTLGYLFHGSPVRVCANRLAWEFPSLFGVAREFSRILTEATGSKLSFKFWRAFSQTKYWQGVRNEGETLDSLRALAGQPLAALMFHSISVPARHEARWMCVSPPRFLKFMEWMKIVGVRPTLPDGAGAAQAARRPVLLTFDDGYDDFYWEAFPVLERLGFPALLFVVVDRLGKFNDWKATPALGERRLLSAPQVQEMHRHGIEIGSHTLTHPWLTRASEADLRREVKDSKARLEDLLGAEVSCFAYPYGDVDVRVRAAVAEAGYRFALSVAEGKNYWGDPLWMKRVAVSDADNLLDFSLKLATGRDFRAAAIRRILRDGASAT